MSKYTTQVRFICETAAGRDESAGFSEIESILDKSWASVFTTKCEFFDEAYRPVLCKKILKHYYAREIGCESVGLWKLWMNTRLEEIMPYYNKMYAAEKLEFDPLEDVNVQKDNWKNTDGKEDKAGTEDTDFNTLRDVTGSSNYEDSADSGHENWMKHSDTPQGSIQDLDSDRYMSDATKDTGSENSHSQGENSSTGKTTGNDTTDRDYTDNRTYEDHEKAGEHIWGKQGSGTYSEMIMKYRESLIKLDLMVIEEFEDLFMQLW